VAIEEEAAMKSKKAQPGKKPVARSKKKSVPAKKDAAKRTEVSPGKKEFAKFVWPRIKDATRFVDVPESQGMVSYARPSGEQVTATLKWYTVSHGPRILGYYDEETDVCYIGQFIEG
jgi:hypothetical protein